MWKKMPVANIRSVQDHAVPVHPFKIRMEKGTVSKTCVPKMGSMSKYVWEGGVTDPHLDCWAEGGEWSIG